MRGLAWALLAGASALLLAASLPLLLSHLQALAQPVAETAALMVEKRVSADVAAPGDTLTYTIRIQESSDPLTLWMTDTLPGEVTYVTDSLQIFGPGSVGFANGVVTWTGELGYLMMAVITFSVETSPEIEYAEVVNTAQVTGTGELIEDAATTLVVVNVGNLDNEGTEKTVSLEEAEPGDVLTYTITLSNNSNDPVPGVWITDELPSGLIPITESLTADEGDCGIQNGVITWTLDMEGYWANIDLTFSAQISPDLPYNGWITNTVEIVAPLQSFTRSVGTNVYQGYPHLEASKSVYPDWVHPGECLTYTVHIVNTGDGSVETAWMTDVLPAEVNYVPGSLDVTTGDFGAADDVITWTGSLAPSEEATITFVVETLSSLENNTRLTNTAEIAGAGRLVQASVEAEAITTFNMIFPIVFYNYPPVAHLDPIPTPENHSYEITWQGVEATIDHYVLQQARDSKFSSLDHVWTTTLTSQVIADVYCAHYYRVRADKASDWGQGPWSNVEQGEASPPDPPVLDISDPSGDNSYTVSWSPVSVDGAVVYVLQESTDAGFSSVTQEWQTTTASQLVEKGSTYGTFYYRVRADDDDCWGQGSWSGVKSVKVQRNYYDSFNSASSGWTTHEASCCLSGCDGSREHLDYKYNLYYGGGRYHVYIPTNCLEGGDHGWTRHIYPVSLAPGIERPSSQTCIEMRGGFEKWNWCSSWGLVFAANDDMSTNYSIRVDDRGDWAIIKRTGYQYPGPNHPCENETRTDIVAPVGGARWPVVSGSASNTLRVEVSGQRVKLFINGHKVHTFSDAEIPSLRRIGIIGGNWEWGDTRIRYDYFFMDEGCDTY